MSELNASNLRKENGGQGPDLVGITTLTSQHYMVPPSGTTEQRPAGCAPGTLRFNTDIGSLEYYRGDTIGWESIDRTTPDLGGGLTSGSIDGTGARAIFAGGYTPSVNPNDCFNNVDALTIATLGNTIDFNNLTANLCGGYATADRVRVVHSGGIGPRAYTPGVTINSIQYANFASQGDYVDGGDLNNTRAFGAAVCDATRSICGARAMPSYHASIDYFTTQTAGFGQDFGDIHTAKGYSYGMMSSTRGLIAGGVYCCPGVAYNIIEYVTISTTGDAIDFGDLSSTRYEGAAFGSSTRGMVACGVSNSRVIEYMTIATLGNAIDFGDSVNVYGVGKYGASSPTRGVFGGGSSPAGSHTTIIEHVQIQTQGDSLDFGDFQGFGRTGAGQEGISNAHGGL